MLNTEKTTSYEKVTKAVQTKLQDKLVVNMPYVVCIRRVNNHSKTKGAVAFQVEYIEKKEPRTSQSSRGINMSVMFNQDHDERFNQSNNTHRAWATYTSFEALANALNIKEGISKEQREQLMELEISQDGKEGDRIAVMQPLTPIDYKGVSYEFHIAITEIRESELDSALLNKSQRQSLEHENAVLQTGGENNELIVCAETGEKVLRITEIYAVPTSVGLSKDFDKFVPSKMTESAYKKLNKAAEKLDEEFEDADFDEMIK